MFKLFKKKQQPQVETKVVETENAHIEVSSDGKVTGTVRVKTNFGDIEMPINTNAQELEQELEEKRKRKEDPNSCERQPNEDEVLVPINYNVHDAWGWEKCKMYVDVQFRAKIGRYNNFIMPLSDYNEMVEYINNMRAANEFKWKVRNMYHEALELEKGGNFQDAETLYKKTLELDPQFFETYNRLIIMYHRNKEFDKELPVLQKAVELFPNVEKWKNRLQKISNK